MCRHACVALLCCAAVSAFLLGGQSKKVGSQASAPLLARRVAGLESSQLPLVSLFERALSLAHAPGGMVVVKDCANAPSATVAVRGTTLGDVLRSIERADPRYRWTVEDGVVNLLPKRAVPPLLMVKIDNIDVRGAANPSEAANVLFGLSDFRRGASRLGLHQGGIQSFLGSAGGKSPGQGEERHVIRLHLKHTTVLSSLNAIVRANRGGVWIYNQRSCRGHNVFNIGFSE